MRARFINPLTCSQIFVLLGAVSLIGCQASEPTMHNETSTCEPLSAAQIGTQIVAIYRAAIAETLALLQDQPPAAQIRAEFEANLTRYQEALLTLGQHVLNLNLLDKQTAARAITMEHLHMQTDPVAKQRFADFSAAIFHYHQNATLYPQLKSINIITQFAFFDLLRQQIPDAEARWGSWMHPHSCAAAPKP